MERNLKSSMEKKLTAKSMNKLLKLAAQVSVSFQNPHFSPGRDKRPDSNWHKIKAHYSPGPIVSMIQAREETKNFEAQEPTSPKISCIGQIKHKNKLCRKKKEAYLQKELRPVSHSQPEKINKARSVGPGDGLKKKPAGMNKIFSGRRKSDADHGKAPPLDKAPSLSQMRKFATSRDTLANFDWTTGEIAAKRYDYLCYGEDREYSDGGDEGVVPFSAPILGAGGLVLEPRKEINLWKRRTMAQPKPLQL